MMKKKISSLLILSIHLLSFPLIQAVRPGLQNSGNTCYFNSITQCLASCKPLNDYLEAHKKDYAPASITLHYLDLIRALHGEPTLNTSRRTLLTSLLTFTKWEYTQQDASELLLWALTPQFGDIMEKDGTPTELGKILSMGTTSHQWHGANMHLVKKQEYCNPIQIQITGNNLITCLDSFFSEETLNSKNPLACEECSSEYKKDKSLQKTNFLVSTKNTSSSFFYQKEQSGMHLRAETVYITQGAKKHLFLHDFGTIFCIQLKRFAGLSVKNEAAVSFPLEFTIKRKWVLPETPPFAKLPTYKLIGFSTHMGGTGGGHYVADAYDWRDGKWYHLNDSTSTQYEEKDLIDKATSFIKKTDAYILFYQKKDTISPISPPPPSHSKSPSAKSSYQKPSSHNLKSPLIDLKTAMENLHKKLSIFSKRLDKLRGILK